MSRWGRDLALGARLALAGGPRAWTRTILTAVGVGLGVALLLFAAAVPNILPAHDARTIARDEHMFAGDARRSAQSLLIANADTRLGEDEVRGRLVQAEGPRPVTPPGVERLPAPGEMVVSPALGDLLASEEGRSLRERLPYRIVGEIGDAGLEGPQERTFYAGTAELAAARAGGSAVVSRVDRFGTGEIVREPLDPTLAMMLVVVVTALLVPVAIFVGTAARFGGEARDRRLAALRLVGADARMTRRIAAGESLVGALVGLVVGVAVFLVARQAGEAFTLWDMSVFAQDVRPSAALAAIVLVAVPATAVAVTVLALRGVTIEPLGVVRRSVPRPRRVWWRLLAPAAGLLVLAPALGRDVGAGDRVDEAQLAVGVVLLLLGVCTLLPWLVEAVVGRLRGGGVARQLATRRLQLDAGTSARVVSGIAVAVAGAIALQTLFSGAEGEYVTDSGADLSRGSLTVDLSAGRGGPSAAELGRRLGAVEGVRDALVVGRALATGPRRGGAETYGPLTVADCAVLRELVRVGACGEGTVVRARGDALVPRAGDRVALDGPARWRLPADMRTVAARTGPDGDRSSGIYATPGALRGVPAVLSLAGWVALEDPGDAAAIERVRGAAAEVSPLMQVWRVEDLEVDSDFGKLRRGLLIGAVGVLLLIGASMLVGALDQLRERRRVLAALVAFGTPRGTLTGSILWQTLIPVAIGLALAVAVGVGLGALLVRLADQPLRLDVGAIAAMTAAGAVVVALVTLLSMPALWRLMRPEGLRTE